MAAAGKITEKVIDTSTGFIIAKEQDCEDMIKAIKAAGETQRRRVNTQAGQKYLGSVPILAAQVWAKEWGVRIYSKEWLERAGKRLRNEPDWMKLRARQ